MSNTLQLVKDQIGREVQVPTIPKRIVSLVPSQTELLFDLGLDEAVVGITWFCIHPVDKYKEKPKIGGTKNVKIKEIQSLNPDLIIANKEENEKEQVEALSEFAPVWVSDVDGVETALEMIREVGKLVNREEVAGNLVNQIAAGFRELQGIQPKRTLYFIWRKPYMVVGGDTFIHEMLSRVGLNNLTKDQFRYPELTAEMLQDLNPELILLSSEPYPFKDRHIKEFQELVPNAEVRLVDGSMFSWYGSRMLKAVDYLKEEFPQV